MVEDIKSEGLSVAYSIAFIFPSSFKQESYINVTQSNTGWNNVLLT